MHPHDYAAQRKASLREDKAAQHLGLSVRTLQKWRVRGGGPPYHKLGRAVRYSADDLDAFIEAGRRTSTSDPGPTPAPQPTRYHSDPAVDAVVAHAVQTATAGANARRAA
jgi:excisionase family DNA binding protein